MNVPDNDRVNQEQFLELLKSVDPELAMVKQMLLLAKVDSNILLQIIKGIGNINSGTGYGRVTIDIHGHTVQGISTEEKLRLVVIES